MRNRYLHNATISEPQFPKILQLWCAEVGAIAASKLCKVNNNTTHRIYGLLRSRVVALAEAESAPFTGNVDVDESYFGPRVGELDEKWPLSDCLNRQQWCIVHQSWTAPRLN
jgi:hypothetical protein